ncbi:MAG: cobalamin B12-binding domain-containing protein [Anaerolineales bacterium]|nr:cobalamin B12-binding domain-containing protein [Anaerolineales bacterium]
MPVFSNLPEYRTDLIHKITDLREQEVLALVHTRLAANDDPLNIVEDCQEGLRQVGERYERREYYLSGLIMAGEIFREVMELLSPIIEIKFTGQETGTILLGTVAGDIHDIGKNNLSLLLTSYGFTVYDLGVDVPPQEFLNKAIHLKPDLIGLSGLITSSFDSMRETVRLLRESDNPQVAATPIILGGNQLNEQVCQYIGGDAWVTDAMTGVRLCQSLLADRKPSA